MLQPAVSCSCFRTSEAAWAARVFWGLPGHPFDCRRDETSHPSRLPWGAVCVGSLLFELLPGHVTLPSRESLQMSILNLPCCRLCSFPLPGLLPPNRNPSAWMLWSGLTPAFLSVRKSLRKHPAPHMVLEAFQSLSCCIPFEWPLTRIL